MDNLTLALFGLAFLLGFTAQWLQLRWLRQLRSHQRHHCGLMRAAFDLIDPEGMQQAREELAGLLLVATGWQCSRCGDHFTPEDAVDGDVSPLCSLCRKAEQAAAPPEGSRLVPPDHPIHDQGHQDDPIGVSWTPTEHQ